MSQNTQKEPQVSEDLFTTQDLLENTENIDEPAELVKETTNEVQMSLDFAEIAESDEIIAESENIVRSEDFTEDPGENIAAGEFAEEDEIEENDEIVKEPEEVDEVIEDLEEVAENIEESDLAGDSEVILDEPGKKPAAAKPSLYQRISELPLSKVKHIIKLDPDVNLVNAEAVFLITKATECFVRTLAKESFNFAVQQKKKTITKAHIDQALTMLPIEMM